MAAPRRGPAGLRRRSFLAAASGSAAALLAGGCAGGARWPGADVPAGPAGPAQGPANTAAAAGVADAASAVDAALLDDLARRAFDYFWDHADAATGLVPDRWPTPSFASIAATGFALSAYAIGVGRGWITRAAGAERARRTLAFLAEAPQGPEPRGRIGHRGLYYHFLDLRPGAGFGLRFGEVEISTIDTALLVAGALHAARFFDGADADEAALRRDAERIAVRADWRWAQVRPPTIGHGWTPERGHLPSDWRGYNEALLLVLLALGSPTHAVGDDAWDAWASGYPARFGTFFGQTHLHYPVLFVHQFPHAWIDFRGVGCAFLRERGLDYFENSRRATLAQRAYAQANPLGWRGYGGDVWGLTACDGPADVERPHAGRLRRFITYAGRGAGTYDDGTIAPYGAGSSLPFAPELAGPALRAMRALGGGAAWGRHGFLAFNRSFDFADAVLTHGRVVPGFGWVDTDWLGIEVGPLLMMLANHRDDGVWRTMRGEPQLLAGLRRAGMRGGWLG